MAKVPNKTIKRRIMRRRVRTKVSAGGQVEQSHKDRCNINHIISHYRRTGFLPEGQRLPRYGDFTGVQDFHDCQNRLRQAESDFMKVPADIRARFDNDPGAFIEFVSDPENRAEMVEMGLLKPDPTQRTPANETPQEDAQEPESETPEDA